MADDGLCEGLLPRDTVFFNHKLSKGGVLVLKGHATGYGEFQLEYMTVVSMHGARTFPLHHAFRDSSLEGYTIQVLFPSGRVSYLIRDELRDNLRKQFWVALSDKDARGDLFGTLKNASMCVNGLVTEDWILGLEAPSSQIVY
ncbi:hypothetical protein GHT06_003853 [Daphnia sinensis]|uniref:Uncharacterized protein n=1 Tax=Daphnia sinensis TaxID=1820382 RepID=A0AAD5KEW6_9CRUS|nr:hypothetical protein GHT06_003853 [Daphnia sinensis]